MLKNFSLAKAIVLVFVASACTMVIELVAGRILAPYIGVSLYTWTSIIGVVLGGISLGNYLGGKVGDRFTSPLLLSTIFFAGAMLTLGILPITLLLKASPLPATFHIMSRTTLYTLALFFLPTTVLGMVTPVVIKLTLKDLGKTANVVGTIYAISTVGAIVGTFLTGFFLISWFGTRAIIWQVAAILFLLALFSAGFWRSKVKMGLMAMTLIVAVPVFQFRDSFQIANIKESNYFTINVSESVIQGRTIRALSLDHLIHSFVDPNDPTYHGYPYENTFAILARHVAKSKPDFKSLFIGGGGYAFPRYLEVTYPKASIEVIEIDPEVTKVVYSHLGLSPTSRIVTYNMDGRIFLIDRQDWGKYDVVVGDAFNDTSVPYHLTTLEFNESIKSVMTPGGIYMVNLIDDLRNGRFVRSFMKTLKQSFRNVYLVMGIGTGLSTYVVMATDADFGLAEFASIAGGQSYDGNLMTLEDIERTLGKTNAVVLTDDYAPVDNMIAPLFATR